ncbi:unnamed protein product, partial [Urochloa humidicola]
EPSTIQKLTTPGSKRIGGGGVSTAGGQGPIKQPCLSRIVDQTFAVDEFDCRQRIDGRRRPIGDPRSINVCRGSLRLLYKGGAA